MEQLYRAVVEDGLLPGATGDWLLDKKLFQEYYKEMMSLETDAEEI